MSTAEFQDAFANALLATELSADALAAVPRLGDSDITALRFAVYRERVLCNLREILANVYPTVARVMAADEFERMGNAFFIKHPPRSVDPVLITEMFAAFVEGAVAAEPSATEDQGYLADLATLDYGCYQARNAVDASAVNTRIFTELTPELLSARRIQLHPACFWLSSPFAVYDLWQRYNSSLGGNQLNLHQPQEVVIIRPHLQVEVHRVDVGLVKALDALDAGATINAALLQGNMADPGFNAVGAMQFLIQNDLIISLY